MSDPMLAEVLRAVNNLSERVDVNHRATTASLNGHMEEEEGEIKKFTESFNSFKESSERRHAALLQSINSYMEKQNDIEEAFLTDKQGRRDFIGHKSDHEERLERAQIWRRRLDTVLTAVVTSAAIGGLAWLGVIVWRAFLQGPVK